MILFRNLLTLRSSFLHSPLYFFAGGTIIIDSKVDCGTTTVIDIPMEIHRLGNSDVLTKVNDFVRQNSGLSKFAAMINCGKYSENVGNRIMETRKKLGVGGIRAIL